MADYAEGLKHHRPGQAKLRCSKASPWVALVVLSVLAVGALAQACNVPVFRFALERWRADSYRVTVFHQGGLSPADKALLVQLEEQQEKSLANVTVRTLEVSAITEAEDRTLLEALSKPQFPALTLQFPAALKIAAPVWSAPLDSSSTAKLLDSPLRQELLRRLVDGETAVWLLLECGNAEKDNAAAMLLEEQLVQLAKELKLPELTDLPDDNLVAQTPLKLAFSLLRVPRSEAEAPLVQMLLHCESDLLVRPDPMVFPVFGRGRALLPLVGAGITADNIQGSAAFLVGACSCEVKELNPGFDLLLTADWDRLLSADGQPLPVVTPRQIADAEPELVPIPRGGSVEASDTGSATPPATTTVAAKPSAAPQAGGNRSMYALMAIAGAFVALIVLVNFNRAKPPAA